MTPFVQKVKMKLTDITREWLPQREEEENGVEKFMTASEIFIDL